MISVTVTDQDPNRAARIANVYVDELHAINSRLIIGEASLRRNFFAQQLALEKDRLTDAEIALQQTEETDRRDLTCGPDRDIHRSGGLTPVADRQSRSAA